MDTGHRKNFSWDFYSKVIILSYCVLQLLRWRIFPQFMDTYYHLLTAWGFIQAGGYSGWDFWQYAPSGRVHIYPPLFHLVLAFFIKAGASKIILAKFFEAAMPALFLIVLWRFIRRNYSEVFAFFVALAFSSSFPFYLSLINHIPATLALIFGFLALGQLFAGRLLRCLILLTLCFYTHIGIPWFFAFSLFLFALFNPGCRKECFIVLACSLMLALPVLAKQLLGLKYISALGLNLSEKYACQIKIIDYLFAFFGALLIFKKEPRYRLFVSFFAASLIFLSYPYRFFSAEGYLPVIFLSAAFYQSVYENFKDKKVYLQALSLALPALFVLFLSPTLSMNVPEGGNKPAYRMVFSGSAATGMFLARGESMWLDRAYQYPVSLIQENSHGEDIIYSTLNFTGISLASISGRATANALFPEIKASQRFDPFSSSKIIIFNRLDDPGEVSRIVNYYNLKKIGESKMFIIYSNSLTAAKAAIARGSVSFKAVLAIFFIAIFLFWQSEKMFDLAKKYVKLIFL